jgi:nucleotide-binding universal stress UspA family protein
LTGILVAVDGSNYSAKIVDFACDLGQKMKEKLVLIYVSKDPEIVEEYIEIGGTRSISSAQRASVATAESITSDLMERIEKTGISHEVVLESGPPAEKIVLTAGERKCDLIVIGLKGLHGVERLRTIGSVSRKVLESSPCPVAIVNLD